MSIRHFSKVLIANRGEIACRIIRTLKKMGIRSVAVYSDADRNALHVELADEAIHIGGSPSTESYLNIPRLIDAAKRTKADAIHPGYGFLSENADFAEQCEKNAICFIGPPVEAIRAMGSKSAAKRLMQSIDVPLIPGYHGDEQSETFQLKEAEKIGFPVLVKAAMGGGGKGMRVSHSAADFADAVASCKREALASFADDTLLLEKYIERPRHVEIQVFCDKHGNAVHLFERDCSIQRRHQKIIEESPAPNLPDAIRAGMNEAAIAAAKAIQYVGAGTVEFLYDGKNRFYFMEMNTRLQVEHPVTEMITGEDLVQWQVQVAQSMPLPKIQDQITQHGHAIEVRICAENPANDFMPSIGNFKILSQPEPSDNVRLDTGIRRADAINIYYDSMVAKLICWDKTRTGAISRLQQALEEFCVDGIETNISYLHQLISNAHFKQAELATDFISVNQESLVLTKSAEERHIAVAALHEHLTASLASQKDEWALNTNWRSNSNSGSKYRYSVDGKVATAIVNQDGFYFDIKVRDSDFRVEAKVHDELIQITGSIDGTYRVFQTDTKTSIVDECFRLQLLKTFQADVSGQTDSARKLTSPMPGVITNVLVEIGQSVSKGQALIIMEAMKMEHIIRANKEGVVKELFCSVGTTVEGGFCW